MATGGNSSVCAGRYSNSSAMAPSTSSDSTAHRPLDLACAATPPSCCRPTSTPVNSSTICGPETKATASEFMTTRSDMPSSRAGPETTGPVTAVITGTMPLHLAMAAAAMPHPCRAATPSWTSAPLEATMKTNGMRRWRACSAASARRTPSAWVMAPRRMEARDRQMTTLRPPIRPTTEVTAPTVPLPTSVDSATCALTAHESTDNVARGLEEAAGKDEEGRDATKRTYGEVSGRRQGPERPPDFSHSATCSMVMVRSDDLHMS